jgi:hypothetical protein
LKTPADEANEGCDNDISLVLAGINALNPVPETRAEIVIVLDGVAEKEASTSGLEFTVNDKSFPILTSVFETAEEVKEYAKPFM